MPKPDTFKAVTRDDVDDIALLPRRFDAFSVLVLEALQRLEAKLDRVAERQSAGDEDRDELRRSVEVLELRVFAAIGDQP